MEKRGIMEPSRMPRPKMEMGMTATTSATAMMKIKDR